VTYRLVYTERAIKDIRKLDSRVRKRVGSTLLRFENDPLKHAEHLTDSEIGSYRFRVGDYRVIFDIVNSDIVVLRVGHRREIYKR